MTKRKEIILRSIVKSAYHQFGEENVELQYQSEEENTYGYVGDILIIRVPEVLMSNDSGIQYLNKNLWVKIHIGTGLFYLAKSVYTIQEEINFYIHSHVGSGSYFDPTRFYPVCLGRGPLLKLISEILAETNSLKLIKLWQLYMMQLQVFLETESVEGVPYKYMANVLSSSNTRQGTRVYDYKYHNRGSQRIDSDSLNTILNNTARRVLIEKVIPIQSVIPFSYHNIHVAITSIKSVEKQSDYELSRNVLKVTEIYLEEYWKYVKDNPISFDYTPDVDTEAMISSIPGMMNVLLDKYNRLKVKTDRSVDVNNSHRHGVLLVFKGEPIITSTDTVIYNPELTLFVIDYKYYSHILTTIENIIKINREYGKHYLAI